MANDLKLSARIAIDKIKPHPKNTRIHSDDQIARLVGSLQEFGFTKPILCDEKYTILAGHGIYEAAKAMGESHIPVIIKSGLTAKQKRAYIIADNKLALLSDWDKEKLKIELKELDLPLLELTGFLDFELNALFGADSDPKKAASKKLSESFGIAPFSVFNARDGWWQDRKRAWLELGIQSEIGRGDNLLKFSNTVNDVQAGHMRNGKPTAKAYQTTKFNKENAGRDMNAAEGTSVFDPVLCELSYKWFSPKGGQVLDPFAGGSVRGIVAARLGRKYHGIDLSNDQIKANRIQAKEIIKSGPMPKWIAGNALDKLAKAPAADFLFTCPPYGNLEIYSDHPADLSNMNQKDFIAAYNKIIGLAVDKLKDDRFAAIVVGDYRDKAGNYQNFVSETCNAFIRAGMNLYNEAILVTAIGSLPIRARKQFENSRKLGKTHQNVLIFIKGSAKAASDNIGKIEFGNPNAIADN